MHVQVEDGLAGSGAVIYADVVTVRVIAYIEDLLDGEGKFVERSDLCGGGFKEAGHMSFGHDQDVASIDRVAIVEGFGQVVFADDIRPGLGAENAVLGHQQSSPPLRG